MRTGVVLCLATVALVSCQQSEKADGAAPSTVSASGAAPASSSAQTAAATARREQVSDDLIDFDYAYSANAAAIPGLKTWLDQDIARQKTRLIRQARESRREAKAGGWTFTPLGYWVEWQTVTDLPGWLSLSTEVGTFEGGAHPNHNFATLLWDRQANRLREPASLFTSPAALSAALRQPFCRELDVQRKERRGADYVAESPIESFDGCIDPLENGTLILGSSSRKTFDRLGILVPPYNAGPYAEGSYEVTLPVTEKVRAAVRPEFRNAFAVER